jgi:hypothetical protein
MIIWKSTDLEAEMEIEKQNWDQKGSDDQGGVAFCRGPTTSLGCQANSEIQLQVHVW